MDFWVMYRAVSGTRWSFELSPPPSCLRNTGIGFEVCFLVKFEHGWALAAI